MTNLESLTAEWGEPSIHQREIIAEKERAGCGELSFAVAYQNTLQKRPDNNWSWFVTVLKPVEEPVTQDPQIAWLERRYERQVAERHAARGGE